MKPCPTCSEIVRAVAGIAALVEVSDDFKVVLVEAALNYEPPASRKRRRKRSGKVLKLVPSEPPRAS
jgi:hypothetical protein